MKILLYTDVHFSQYSSIVRGRGSKYSKRLETVIESLNWAEKLAESTNCDAVVSLGDTFDKPELNAEELTALKEVIWSKLPHYFLVGNHESNISSLQYSSAFSLNISNFNIINSATILDIDDNTEIVFIPYVVEGNRKDLTEYFKRADGKICPKSNRIVFSHNDIKGIKYGLYESKEGFELNEIEDSCSLFINGHLHNGSFLNDKQTILNLGNLTGQNFSEDGFKYQHFAAILDTSTNELTFYENPFAQYFYKIEINTEKDLNKLYTLKSHAVVSIKCNDKLSERCRDILNKISNIDEYKLILYKDLVDINTDSVVELIAGVDHIKQFNDFVLEKLGDDSLIVEELMKVSTR